MKKIWKGFKNHMEWFWGYYVVICVVVLFFGLLVYSESKREYLKAPIEACTQTYTGRVEERQEPQQMCAGYDKNGACTAPFTIYNTVTYREVAINCNWSKWQ